MDISQAWGYGAVFMPSALYFQGFVINDPDLFRDDIAALKWAMRQEFIRQGRSDERDASGALQATLVEVTLKGDEGRMAIIGAALADYTKSRFYIVTANHHDAVATATSFEPLAVETAEAARDLIKARGAPLVAALRLKMLTERRH